LKEKMKLHHSLRVSQSSMKFGQILMSLPWLVHLTPSMTVIIFFMD